MKHIYTGFITLLFVLSIYPQQEKDGLLWEISGNGLDKPSYLFGTIHTSMEEFFDLNDSVFIAIESSESFAGEIDLDSLQSFVLKIYEWEKKKDYKDASELLTEEQFNKLKEKIKERLGRDYEDLDLKNPAYISSALEEDKLKGTMPFFMDEYLFKIAKSRDKKIIGLEYLDDQIKAFFELTVEEQRKALLDVINEDEDESEIKENLFDAYLTNDLQKISEIISYAFKDESEKEKRLLENRNIKMAESIDTYIRQKSIFAAAGAAHLPGDKGLIKLLQEKGYKLRPVRVKHSHLAAKYKKEMIESPWIVYTPEDGGFSIEMPGTPVEVPLPQQTPSVKVDFRVYSDVSSNIAYFACKFIYPTVITNRVNDSLLQNIIKGMNYEIEEIKDIQYNDLIGKEVLAHSEKSVALIKLFVRENKMYMLQAITGDDINHPDIDHFYNSFKIAEESDQTASLSDYYINEKGAFKVKFPQEPYYQEMGEESKSHIFSGSDEDGRSFYMLIYSNVALGPYYSDTTFIYNRLTRESDKLSVSDIKNISGQYPAYRFKSLSNSAPMDGLAIMRAGRLFMLMTGAETDYDSAKGSAFLNSFEFIDFLPVEWKEFKGKHNDFSVNFPGEPVFQADTFSTEIRYQDAYAVVDENSGIPYTLYKYTLSDYCSIADDSVFYSYVVPKSEEGADTVLLKDTVINNLKVRDFVFRMSYNNYGRIKAVLNGSTAYVLTVSAPEDYIYGGRIEPFFSSFNIIEQNNSDVYADKSEKLFEDLQSPDSTIRKYAALYCNTYIFKEEHLDKMYSLLSKAYPDDNDEEGVRKALFNELRYVDSDSKFNFIRNIYPSLADYDILQEAALIALTDLKTDESAQLFLDLILSDTPRRDYVSYQLLSPFHDSLKLAIPLFPELLNLLQYKEYKDRVYYLLRREIDSMYVNPEQYARFEQTFINDCKTYITELDSAIAEDEENRLYGWGIDDIVAAFPAFGNNQEAKALLRELINRNQEDILFSSAVSLIKMNEEVPQEYIEKICANTGIRNSFYAELLKMSRTNIFPPGYLTQQHFAESDLYRIISYGDEEPDSLILLDSLRNEEGKFYLYKFKFYEDENTWYVGLSGPQPANDSEVITSGKKTKTNYSLMGDKTISLHWEELLKEETSDGINQ